MINYNNLMERFALDRNELGAILFPDNKFPLVAVGRIVDGNRDITLSQLGAIADYLGVTKEMLLNNEGRICAFVTFPDSSVKVRILDDRETALFYCNNRHVSTLLLTEIEPGESILAAIIAVVKRVNESELL